MTHPDDVPVDFDDEDAGRDASEVGADSRAMRPT